jgi:hypothetical protein
MKELEKTKFCRIYRMPKVLPNNAFQKTANFCIKAYFDFCFHIRQFPFNPGYLTSVSAPKLRDIKIFPFKAGLLYMEKMWRFKDAESIQHLYSARSTQQGAAVT